PNLSFRVARLRILRFLPPESSVYFRFRSAVLRGMSQLSVGQWWRIIGSFSALTTLFCNFIFNRMFFALFNIKTTQSG
ncbi:hypothetical protein, partial [Xenorhabdus sp. KK7.4]|uniref:hypothetical protein n=1 Tax=Xenorhabdus sp. KK7.4 TaxID=1851572 RepID=UPI0019D4C853